MFKLKLTKVLAVTVLFVAAFFTLGFDTFSDNKTQSQVFDVVAGGNPSPIIEKQYFERFYEPYTSLTPDMRIRMAQEVQGMRDEANSVNSWTLWGPIGQRIYGDPGTNYYSGRILDIEVANT